MKILLVGSGGREHALAWKLSQSPLVREIVAAPGNPGVARHARLAPIKPDEVAALTALAVAEAVDLVVIGPEAPLTLGLADRLREAGVPTFGPSAAAARLEGSKAFTKALCQRAGIPTAASHTVATPGEATAALDRMTGPFVLKADGLAAGKGVVIVADRAEAVQEAQAMLAGRFGDASRTLVIEEFLEGEEASVFAICDGTSAVLFDGAQDHKRAFDGDAGPNTGGMGAYSPAPVLTPDIMDKVRTRIIEPALAEMRAEGAPFIGVLFAGVMIGREGPRLIEFNVRFGDPECQVLMMRFAGDLAGLLHAAALGRLAEAEPPVFDPAAAVTVVYAASGYPEAPRKGDVIRGVAAAESLPDVMVFHAGTVSTPDGRLLSDGGRVLNISARGATLREAVQRAYAAVATIDWPHGFYRRDIAARGLAR